MSLVYILHFDARLAHAEHYLGVSSIDQLQRRLRDHANGNGARLTEVLWEQGIEWRLGGLISAPGHPRIVEAHLKQIGHTKRYCEICSKIPKRIRGTTPMSIGLVKFDARSIALRTVNPPIRSK